MTGVNAKAMYVSPAIVQSSVSLMTRISSVMSGWVMRQAYIGSRPSRLNALMRLMMSALNGVTAPVVVLTRAVMVGAPDSMEALTSASPEIVVRTRADTVAAPGSITALTRLGALMRADTWAHRTEYLTGFLPLVLLPA